MVLRSHPFHYVSSKAVARPVLVPSRVHAPYFGTSFVFSFPCVVSFGPWSLSSSASDLPFGAGMACNSRAAYAITNADATKMATSQPHPHTSQPFHNHLPIRHNEVPTTSQRFPNQVTTSGFVGVGGREGDDGGGRDETKAVVGWRGRNR